MHLAKVVELVGESDQNWFDAVENAVSEASQTVDHITGVEVYNLTANVRDGRITEWKANVKIAFAVDTARRKNGATANQIDSKMPMRS
ncbi:MAG: dodecin family protein [Thermaerobacterales bacterium]